MSPEALRAAFYAIGATLVAVAEFDDVLVAASIPALGIISPAVSKVLLAIGTLAVGYAKTGQLFGDMSIRQVVGGELAKTVAAAKEGEQK